MFNLVISPNHMKLLVLYSVHTLPLLCKVIILLLCKLSQILTTDFIQTLV